MISQNSQDSCREEAGRAGDGGLGVGSVLSERPLEATPPCLPSALASREGEFGRVSLCGHSQRWLWGQLHWSISVLAKEGVSRGTAILSREAGQNHWQRHTSAERLGEM